VFWCAILQFCWTHRLADEQTQLPGQSVSSQHWAPATPGTQNLGSLRHVLSKHILSSPKQSSSSQQMRFCVVTLHGRSKHFFEFKLHPKKARSPQSSSSQQSTLFCVVTLHGRFSHCLVSILHIRKAASFPHSESWQQPTPFCVAASHGRSKHWLKVILHFLKATSSPQSKSWQQSMSALFVSHAHLPSSECVRASKFGRRVVFQTHASENIPRQIQTLLSPHTKAGSGGWTGGWSDRASPRRVCLVDGRSSSISGRLSSISGKCSLWGVAKASVSHALVLAPRSVRD
jgi:hypothetical protein